MEVTTTYPENTNMIAHIWLKKQIQRKKDIREETRGRARLRVAYKRKYQTQGIPLPTKIKYSPISHSLCRGILENTITRKLGVKTPSLG